MKVSMSGIQRSDFRYLSAFYFGTCVSAWQYITPKKFGKLQVRSVVCSLKDRPQMNADLFDNLAKLVIGAGRGHDVSAPSND